MQKHIFKVTETIKKNYEVVFKIWLKKKKWTDHPSHPIPSIPSHPSVNTRRRGRLVPRGWIWDALSTVRARLGTARARLGTVRARLGTARAGLGTLRARLGTARARLGTVRARLGTARVVFRIFPKRMFFSQQLFFKKKVAKFFYWKIFRFCF